MAETSERGRLPDPEIIKKALPAVVQILALRQSSKGNMSVVWTGSGTIVEPKGIILTNCHVANPRAMGMPGPQADKLAIALTRRSDEPPALTYLADIVVQSPELDLAVLKISTETNGKAVTNLDLPFLPIGDSDELELGDMIAIFGYPGIGGDTVTFTSGSVAGFTHEQEIGVRRAWIKTDATIAGGNSGGTTINHQGELVGVPTQASAGTGIAPVDARAVVDTNQDGRIDDRDTPMSIGGFINGLRPINLAKPLLRQAGVAVSGADADAKIATTPPPPPNQPPSQRSTPFTNLVFSSQITADGRPLNPTTLLPSGTTQINVTFDYQGMNNGLDWGQVWALNGETILSDNGQWHDGASGRKIVVLAGKGNLPDGQYHLVLTVQQQIAAEGVVVVGKQIDDTDTEISGQVVDQRNNQGIADVLVIALKPGIRVMDFVNHQNPAMAFTSARTDQQGNFTFPIQLPKGQAYGLVVVAKGYQDLVVEGALRISPMAPEHAQLSPILLQAE